ncbi:MAG: tetratricopeptide repeat protein, partial [Proteobacteria bacterium]|nr:tetratricopeptide repeat protein [Pseudomonadota bacterium]
ALSVFRSIGEPKQIAESLILRFEIHHHAGDSAAGIPFLEEALHIAERLDSHYLVIIAHYNLAASHVKMGSFREAEESLKKLRGLYNIEISQAIAWHARWLDGAIRQGLGDFKAAETCFMEARHGFLEADQLGYVAQVGLDLALLYSEQERSSDVRRLVMEILPAFSALRVSREATVAIELLRNATMGAQIPYALLQEIRVHMEKIRLDPTFQFKHPRRESN